MAKAKVLSVNDLFKYCKMQISNGNGDKKILVATDDEGNEFRPMYFQFCEKLGDCMYGIYDEDAKKNPQDYIILG